MAKNEETIKIIDQWYDENFANEIPELKAKAEVAVVRLKNMLGVNSEAPAKKTAKETSED